MSGDGNETARQPALKLGLGLIKQLGNFTPHRQNSWITFACVFCNSQRNYRQISSWQHPTFEISYEISLNQLKIEPNYESSKR